MQMKLSAVLIVCLMLLSISVATQLGGGDTDDENPWPYVGGNLQNTGQSKFDTSHVDGEIVWNRTIYEGLVPSDTSPVIDYEGNLYLSAGNIIISLDSSGEKRWDYFSEEGELTAPGLGADGTIYTGAREDNKLLALDRDDGSVLWSFDTVGGVTTAPVVDSQNNIYFASYLEEDSARVYSVGTDGNLRWVFDMPVVDNSTKINARVTIGPNGWIYFGSFDNDVYALNRHGDLEWRTDPAPAWGSSTQIFSSPAIQDGVLYVGTVDGIAALDAYTGMSVWHFPDESHEEFDFGDQVSVWGSPAVGQNGQIYFGCTYTIPPPQDETYANPVRMGRIYALYSDGDVRWHMETQNIIMSATPAVGSDGTVYMGSNDRAVYAFSPGGNLLWNHSVGRVIDSSPAIGSDGTVYFVTGGPLPNVFAFSGERIPSEDGTYVPHWSVVVGVTAAIIVVLVGVHLYKNKSEE